MNHLLPSFMLIRGRKFFLILFWPQTAFHGLRTFQVHSRRKAGEGGKKGATSQKLYAILLYVTIKWVIHNYQQQISLSFWLNLQKCWIKIPLGFCLNIKEMGTPSFTSVTTVYTNLCHFSFLLS